MTDYAFMQETAFKELLKRCTSSEEASEIRDELIEQIVALEKELRESFKGLDARNTHAYAVVKAKLDHVEAFAKAAVVRYVELLVQEGGS